MAVVLSNIAVGIMIKSIRYQDKKFMHNFKELKVWQQSMDLVASIYEIVKQLPVEEKFNLTSQMKSAAVSIPSNISEGCGRNTTPLLKNFLYNALGSSYELETLIILCNRLTYISDVAFSSILSNLTSIQRMLNKFIATLS